MTNNRDFVRMLDNTTFGMFLITLGDLCKLDPLQRRSPTYAVGRLSGAPLFWTPPVNCYCEARKEQALVQQQARNED